MIDLDKAKGRATVEIRLAGQTFRITRVVTGVRQLYADYTTETIRALDKADTLHRGDDERDEVYEARVVEVTREITEITERNRETFFAMLELILSRNGHELDRQWWDENTDEGDRRRFLDACLSKDVPAQKKTMTVPGSTTKS